MEKVKTRTKSSLDNAERVKPIRTITGDISKILKDKNLSPDKAKDLDAKLKEEIKRYEQEGGDRKIIEILKQKEKEETPLTIRERGITEKDIQKAREKMKELSEEAQKETKTKASTTNDQNTKPEEHVGGATQIGEINKNPETTAQIVTPKQKEVEKKLPEKKEEVVHPPTKVDAGVEDKKLEAEKITVGIKKESLEKKVSEENLRRQQEDLLAKEERQIEEEEISIKSKLGTIPSEISILEKEKGFLSVKNDEFTNRLEPIIKREREIEKEEQDIDMEEKVVDSKEKRVLEKKRWELEEERKKIEKERWEIDKEYINHQKEYDKLSISIRELKQKEKGVNDELDRLKEKRKVIDSKKELLIIDSKFSEIKKEKEKIELDWIVLNEKRKKNLEALKPILDKEKEIDNKRTQYEVEEKNAKDAIEKHNAEKKRWVLMEDERPVQEERWGFEDTLEKIETNMRELKNKYKETEKKERDIAEHKQELVSIIGS